MGENMNIVEKYKQKLQLEEEAEMAYMRAKSQVSDVAAELITEATIALDDLFVEEDLYEIKLDGTVLYLTVYYGSVDVDDLFELMSSFGFEIQGDELHIAAQGSKTIFTFALLNQVQINSCRCGGGFLC